MGTLNSFKHAKCKERTVQRMSMQGDVVVGFRYADNMIGK